MWRTLLPSPAKYLLRIDDLCPTVSRERWEQCRALIEESRLRPILSVVPANLDRELEVSPADASFWQQLRALEAAGAAIGLHGYRHLRQSRGRSLVPLQRVSEFAGVPGHWQRTWIAAGLAILRREGLTPRIWVAPQHGFDENTLRALRAENIHLVSDGFARVPFVRGGMTWIPQQLWTPIEKAEGLWTICIHPNHASEAQMEALRAFLRKHAEQFTSLDAVFGEFSPGALPLAEKMYARMALQQVLMAPMLKRIADRQRIRAGKRGMGARWTATLRALRRSSAP